ncbi:MAG: hypothetical protein U0270_16360 [Labilithrix sp.]
MRGGLLTGLLLVVTMALVAGAIEFRGSRREEAVVEPPNAPLPVVTTPPVGPAPAIAPEAAPAVERIVARAPSAAAPPKAKKRRARGTSPHRALELLQQAQLDRAGQ